ncbi:protein SNORC-like [Conger conger]|uniref:protein SNORC-like n=1 Tax=Conger conger TaxID=82655 RepID=UPI002A5AD854|nr:protein SNORC-like [Conger conger]
MTDLIPTTQSQSLEMSSGGGTYESTTKDPSHDLTENAFTLDYEDTTHSKPINGNDGVLGPGAIAAIVIAVVLGASVLIALIVLTLKRFTTA